jgi:two-component system LytT family response regulator
MAEPLQQTGVIEALIVDDEKLARDELAYLLEAHPEIAVVGQAENGLEAVAMIDEYEPDLVFLDVQMPEGTGLAVAASLIGPDAPRVVMVTAFAEHALPAFDLCAVDYLLKPFDDERFARALDRAKRAVRERQALALARRLGAIAGGGAAPGAPAAVLSRIAVREGGEVRLVPVEEIDWIGAQDYYAELHAGSRSYLLREPLRSLAERLDPRLFARVHRSAIVNVTRVRALEPASHGEWNLVLHDGSRLRLSRSHRSALGALLGR